MACVVHESEHMSTPIDELLRLQVTIFFVLFHGQHHQVAGSGSGVTTDPLEGFQKQSGILIVARNDKTVDICGIHRHDLVSVF